MHLLIEVRQGEKDMWHGSTVLRSTRPRHRLIIFKAVEWIQIKNGQIITQKLQQIEANGKHFCMDSVWTPRK